jgi:hypothetical protein
MDSGGSELAIFRVKELRVLSRPALILGLP